ncbi:glycosyltransferase family 4 protein [Thiorhodovibrio frisius]|nr:glycosyltransferase family 4 protein [Thiorhodovibrio frisius]
MHGGGAERVAALLCNQWASHGHDILLVPTFSGRGECLYPLDYRVRLEFLADRVGTTRRNAGNNIRRLLAMRSMIREFRADAVLSFLTDVNLAVLLATRALGLPVVISERIFPPMMPTGSFSKVMRRLAYPWASHVVMQTQRGADWLAKSVPGSRAVVIANPCVFPIPDAKPAISPDTLVEPDRCLLLAVGRLALQKDFPMLIGAFATLAPDFPTWDMFILGEGSERPRLEAQIEQAGLGGRVHLPGRVGNLGRWYERAQLFALTSRFEGFPNVLLEAMAHGLPVVSLDCQAGPADLIHDGVNGFLVHPSNALLGLISRLRELMEDPPLRHRLGLRAREVRERFALAKIARQWEALFAPERAGHRSGNHSRDND